MLKNAGKNTVADLFFGLQKCGLAGYFGHSPGTASCTIGVMTHGFFALQFIYSDYFSSPQGPKNRSATVDTIVVSYCSGPMHRAHISYCRIKTDVVIFNEHLLLVEKRLQL